MKKLESTEMHLIAGGNCGAAIAGGAFTGALLGAKAGVTIAPSPQGLLIGAAAGAIFGGLSGLYACL